MGKAKDKRCRITQAGIKKLAKLKFSHIVSGFSWGYSILGFIKRGARGERMLEAIVRNQVTYAPLTRGYSEQKAQVLRAVRKLKAEGLIKYE